MSFLTNLNCHNFNLEFMTKVRARYRGKGQEQGKARKRFKTFWNLKGSIPRTFEMNSHFGSWESQNVLNLWDKNAWGKLFENQKWTRILYLVLRVKNCDKKKGLELNWQFDSQSLKPKKQRLINFYGNVWHDIGKISWKATMF